MRVVVTGGAGFIGGNLCAALARSDDIEAVQAVDDLSTGSATNVPPGVELVQVSVLDEARLEAIVASADVIVHLAARPSVPRSIADPGASHAANTVGTFNLLEATRRSPRRPHLVVASSSSVYGANPLLPKREDAATLPLSPYAATKLATEAYTLAWAHSFGFDALVFRFFNVFGPLQPAGHAYAAVVPAFVSAALLGAPLPVFGDGKQTRDFTFVGSVVEVILDAIRRRVAHSRPINLAFGTRISLLELIERLEAILGHTVEMEFREPRQGDVAHSQADTTALHELFPSVAPISLDEGLRQTIAWFAHQGTPS